MEIYIGKSTLNFTEPEPQGAYRALQPDGELTWTVKWYVRELKDPQLMQAGNPALVKLALQLVRERL